MEIKKVAATGPDDGAAGFVNGRDEGDILREPAQMMWGMQAHAARVGRRAKVRTQPVTLVLPSADIERRGGNQGPANQTLQTAMCTGLGYVQPDRKVRCRRERAARQSREDAQVEVGQDTPVKIRIFERRKHEVTGYRSDERDR